MDAVKCKHCCSEISFVGAQWYDQSVNSLKGLWYDKGILFRHVCLSSPTSLHEPETMEISDQSVNSLKGAYTMSEKRLEERFQLLLNAMKEGRDDLAGFYATDLFKNPSDGSPIIENIDGFRRFANCEVIYSGKKIMGFSIGYIFYMGYKHYFG